jgi:hypothetical protein
MVEHVDDVRRGGSVRDETTGIIAERSAELAVAASAAAAEARIKAAVVLAMRNPRIESESRARILDRCDDSVFAEKAIARKPIGGEMKYLLGVRFAEEAIISWKNVFTRRHVIFEDDEKRIISIEVTDLETNVSHDADIVVGKTIERRNPEGRDILGKRKNKSGKDVYILKATEDELLIKEFALSARVFRNNSLRLIPSQIKQEAFDRCMKTISEGAKKDKRSATERMIDDFRAIGVVRADLETYLGHPIEETTAEEFPTLRGIYTAIADGDTTWKDVLAAKQGDNEPPAESDEQPTNVVNDAEVDQLIALLPKFGLKVDDLKVHLGKTYGVISARNLDRTVFDEVIAWVKSRGKKGK